MNKIELKQFKKCSQILNHAPMGVALNPASSAILMQALQKHPKWQEKIGQGVKFISIEESQYGSKTFMLHRIDGSKIDISYRKAFGVISGFNKPKKKEEENNANSTNNENRNNEATLQVKAEEGTAIARD